MDKMKYYVKDEYLMLSVKYLRAGRVGAGLVCIHENDEEVMYFMC